MELVNSVMVPPAINELLLLLRLSFLTGRGFRKTHPLWTDFEPTKTFILEIKGVAIEFPERLQKRQTVRSFSESPSPRES